MSIEAVAPLPQAELDEAMRTLHAPSKVAAAAGVAAGMARRNKKQAAIRILRERPMTSPCGSDGGTIARHRLQRCDGPHTVSGRVIYRTTQRPGRTGGAFNAWTILEGLLWFSSTASRSDRRRTCR